MKLGGFLFVAILGTVLVLAWLADQGAIRSALRGFDQPAAMAATAPEPAPAKPAKVSHPVRHRSAEAPRELGPRFEPVPAMSPAPQPFPMAAAIPLGMPKVALTPFHEPALRSLSVEHGKLNETYVYCPGGDTDTWVRLRDGKVVGKADMQHTPAEPNEP